MKIRVILIILIFSLVAGCRFDLSFYNHEFKLKYSLRLQYELNELVFADLRGDNQELIIQTFPQAGGSGILITDQKGSNLSQFGNDHAHFKNSRMLIDPQNQKRYLFNSINNGKTLYLQMTEYEWSSPRKRLHRVFEPYLRDDELMKNPDYRWDASLTALFIEDIDGDGRQELVVNAIDSYTANPRGLMVFDFDSGKLKWMFRSPTCFTSVLFEDLDGDGEKEFLLGNKSHKNTTNIINGLDDANCYISIVDIHGKLKYSERLIEDFGEIKLQVADIDLDGIPEIYALLLKRSTDGTGNAILRLKYDGKRLLKLDELPFPGNMESISGGNFLYKLDKKKEQQILINNQQKGAELYDNTLNHVLTGMPGIRSIRASGDFLHKGQTNLLASDKNDNLYLLNKNLRAFARLENPFPGERQLAARLLNAGGHQKPIVAIASAKTIHFYEISHISLSVYLYRLLKTYAIWLSLILLAMLIHVVVLIKQRKKVVSALSYHSSSGYLIINRRCHVYYANEMMKNLFQKLRPQASTSNLKHCLPELCEIIKKLDRGKLEFESCKLKLQELEYEMLARRLPGHKWRYLITLTPPGNEMDSEMLQWAETARRLSHHVRRHITNVLLALDPLDAMCPPKEKEYLEIVRSEIDKIRVFTHAFQRFTELREYELKAFDIVPHVEHAIKQARLSPNIKLIKNYSLKSISAYIEPVRFEEALVNLINNATEAMPEGGSLHITLRVFPKHKSPQGVLNVLVEVEDSSNGIPAKYLDDIWKPFFTTNQSGTGIGIPETLKIIKSMGGILDLQSEEGVGTVASMWIKGVEDA